jgi:hypothetical protein
MTDEMMNLPRPDHIKMHQRSSVRRLERQRISPANGTPAGYRVK